MSRAEKLEQLTMAIEQLNSAVARTDPDDRLAFAELHAALIEIAAVAGELAEPEETQP